MKPLQTLLAVFACAALPALGQLVEDPETGLRTGTITVNGQTYTIEPNANLSGADLTGASLGGIIRAILDVSNLVEIWSMDTQITEQATSIESNSAEINDLKTMVEAMSVQLTQLNTQIGDLQAAVARRDATIENLQGDLATAIAERDARFTEDQIRAMSADYTIGLNAAGNVQMKITSSSPRTSIPSHPSP